jgi:para-aminobenzoate synthetase/4-amino-4-deoxychorismate lyase
MNPWHSLPADVFTLVENAPASVLLHASRPSPEHPFSRLFLDPLRVLEVFLPAEIPSLFAEIENALALGQFVAGYFAYECGVAFEPSAAQIPLPKGEALAWFAIYPRCFLFDHRRGAFVGGGPPGLPLAAEPEAIPDVGPAAFPLTETEYAQHIVNIHQSIRNGDVYQLNFTLPLRFQGTGSTALLYSQLSARQPVDYSAFLHTHPGSQILSFSPELFFRIEGSSGQARRITTRPMKGTAARGRTTAEDRSQAAWLQNDSKNRAENLMIVDLIRSDMGRICAYGTVQVQSLFTPERYPTLWQMTSTVAADLRPAVSFHQIFRALFPCGSITGAPKVRAMQLIAELEATPRGVYTGAIGFFSPQETVFSVAIRTLEIEDAIEEVAPPAASYRQWKAKMGVGSGIVIDSNPAAEFRECALKAAFLTAGPGLASSPRAADFKLIETLLFAKVYPLLELHLDRLLDSAAYFDFACSRDVVRHALLAFAADFPSESTHKVRLLMDWEGRLSLSSEALPQHSPMQASPAALRVCIAAQTTDSRDPMLFHKTTHRALYDAAWKQAREAGFHDVLFFNQKGELTESAIANVFVVKDGRWFTPPIECGLLAGVQRRHLLETRPQIDSRVLYAGDLLHADAVYLSNAVRGLQRVEVSQEPVITV